MNTSAQPVAETQTSARSPVLAFLRSVFVRAGVLPFFLVAALIIFTLASTQFLSVQNLTNVARQSVYLTLV